VSDPLLEYVLVEVLEGVREGVLVEVEVTDAVLDEEGVFGGVPEILAVEVEVTV
jgi:urease gamma subunit